MKSLNDTCIDSLVHWIGTRQMDLENIREVSLRLSHTSLNEKLNTWLSRNYVIVRERYSRDALESILGVEKVDIEERRINDIEMAKKLMATFRSGCVIDPISSEFIEAEFYPLRCLVAGVAWPKEVDPTRREDWLDEETFMKVLGMNKNSFKALATFERIRLKKSANLF